MSTIQEGTIFSTTTLTTTTRTTLTITTTKERKKESTKKERKKKIGNRQQHIQVHHVKWKCGSSVIDYNYFFPQIGEIQFWWAIG